MIKEKFGGLIKRGYYVGLMVVFLLFSASTYDVGSCDSPDRNPASLPAVGKSLRQTG
jgi:hypothetical protein